jgi:hypothetical protein
MMAVADSFSQCKGSRMAGPNSRKRKQQIRVIRKLRAKKFL